jgi:predicted small lipoprotein YifL
MARRYRTLVLGLALVAGLACGRKGPLELPPGREPAAVEGLSALLRGDTVVLEWANPVKAVSGRALSGLAAVEVWAFDRGLPAGSPAPSAAEVEKAARLVRRIPREEFGQHLKGPEREARSMVFVYALPANGSARLAFTVRVFDAKGRASDFAPPAAVEIVRKGAIAVTPAGKGGRP